MVPPPSVLTQGDDRLDPYCAAGGNSARGHGHGEQQRRSGGEGRRIEGADPEQQVTDSMTHPDASEKS